MISMKPFPIRWMLASVLTLLPCAQGFAQLEQKTLFSGEFPQLIAFRGEANGKANRSYELWSKDIEGHSAVIRKLWTEEVDLNPQTVVYAQRYMKEHPDVCFLWHLNAESRVAHDKPEVLKKYFPGHWALLTGAFIKQAVPAGMTEFSVSNISTFSDQGFVYKNNTSAPQDLVIVGRKADGTLNWATCEYASIVTVDKKNKKITVKRGQYLSRALNYGEGGVYIAPIIGGVWGGNRLWFYNFATTCPRNAQGQNAADLFLGEILAKIDPQAGDLKGLSGIAFDVMYWQARIEGMDVNDDGVADGVGIVEGKHVWRDGMIDWLTRLRKKVGSAFLLTSDSGFSHLQRGVGLLNGMEAEGFPFHHDAFRGFSRPLNHFAYWKEYGVKEFPFNYTAIKYMLKEDSAKAPQYARFATGAATCSGVCATRYMIEDKREARPIDELTAGVRNQPRWLGKATGALIRFEDSAPDLFKGAGTTFAPDFLSKVTVKGGHSKVEAGSTLHLQGTTDSEEQPIELIIKDIPRPAGDIVVSFYVKSEGPLAPELNGTAYPRMLTVTVDGLPNYPDPVRNNSFFNDLGGAFGSPGFVNQRFYFRDLGKGKGSTITLHLTFEGQGGVELKSLKLFGGSQVMAREFEHGVVLVNPSFDTKTFDLRKVFPNFKGKYRYIKGLQAPNTGAPIDKPEAVAVQSMDALFLERY